MTIVERIRQITPETIYEIGVYLLATFVAIQDYPILAILGVFALCIFTDPRDKAPSKTSFKILLIFIFTNIVSQHLTMTAVTPQIAGAIGFLCSLAYSIRTLDKIKHSLEIANHPESKDVTLVVYDPKGIPFENIDTSMIANYTKIDEKYFEAYKRGVNSWLNASEDDTGRFYNGRKVALRGYSVSHDFMDRTKLRLLFSENDYVTQRAISEVYQELSQRERERLLRNGISNVNPFFSRSFGINLCVVTSDNRLVLIRRNPTLAVNANKITCAVSEGMDSDNDVFKGKPSLLSNAKRGLLEELGVDIGDHHEIIKLTSIALNEERYEWIALGHADFRDSPVVVNSKELVEKWQKEQTRDHCEISEMYIIPFNREDVSDFLDSKKSELVNYTYVAVAHTLNSLIPLED